MKQCHKCKGYKELIEFNKEKVSRDGHRSICKSCAREYDKQFKTKHKERIKKYISNYRNTVLKNKTQDCKIKYGVSYYTIKKYGLELIVNIYKKDNGVCQICGGKRGLSIHHKDRNGYNNPKKGLPMNNELSNLILLCRSCHGREHSLDRFKKVA